MEDHNPPTPEADDEVADDSSADDWWASLSRRKGSRDGPRRSPRAVLIAGAGALAIAVAAVVGVNALTSGSSASTTTAAATNLGPKGAAGGGGHGTAGMIASINGSTISLTNRNGKKTTVVTSASTTVDEAVSGSLSDVRVGDHVAVMGSGSSSSVSAQQIIDTGTKSLPGPPSGGNGQPGGPTSGSTNGPSGPPSGTNGQTGGPPNSSTNGPSGPPSGATGQQGAPPSGSGSGPVLGTVETISGSTLTIKTSSGTTVTATTSSSTKVTIIKTGQVSDLKAGEQIVVAGTTSNGTITATTIRTGSTGLGGGPGGTGGPGGGPGGNA